MRPHHPYTRRGAPAYVWPPRIRLGCTVLACLIGWAFIGWGLIEIWRATHG